MLAAVLVLLPSSLTSHDLSSVHRNGQYAMDVSNNFTYDFGKPVLSSTHRGLRALYSSASRSNVECGRRILLVVARAADVTMVASGLRIDDIPGISICWHVVCLTNRTKELRVNVPQHLRKSSAKWHFWDYSIYERGAVQSHGIVAGLLSPLQQWFGRAAGASPLHSRWAPEQTFGDRTMELVSELSVLIREPWYRLGTYPREQLDAPHAAMPARAERLFVRHVVERLLDRVDMSLDRLQPVSSLPSPTLPPSATVCLAGAQPAICACPPPTNDLLLLLRAHRRRAAPSTS